MQLTGSPGSTYRQGEIRNFLRGVIEILKPLKWRKKAPGGTQGGKDLVNSLTRVRGFQHVGGVRRGFGHHHATFGKAAAAFLERVDIVSEYNTEIRSPSRSIRAPSVVALRDYVSQDRPPAFTRFNVFLRDGFAER
mgnify:CR=1 FL=1